NVAPSPPHDNLVLRIPPSISFSRTNGSLFLSARLGFQVSGPKPWLEWEGSTRKQIKNVFPIRTSRRRQVRPPARHDMAKSDPHVATAGAETEGGMSWTATVAVIFSVTAVVGLALCGLACLLIPRRRERGRVTPHTKTVEKRELELQDRQHAPANSPIDPVELYGDNQWRSSSCYSSRFSERFGASPAQHDRATSEV
ncbi:hypothetical protein B0H63DRAFT_92165, partial [Podospora didyma]